VLVECLPQVGLDNSLTADVQVTCHGIKLVEHFHGKIDVHPLDRSFYFARVGEMLRDVFTPIRTFGDLLGGRDVRCFSDTAFAPPW